MTVRAYQPEDRAEAVELLGDLRALDGPGRRVQVAEDPAAASGRRLAGVATWSKAAGGGEGQFGALVVQEPGDRRLFHELIRACVAEAMVEGVTRGYATVREPGMVAELRWFLGVEPEPAGWDPETKRPVVWRFTVELGPLLDGMNRRIAGPV
ncbi:MAG: hypothetical protein U1B78_07545 [Dehalococcoidia bacterium]|nr:hypothetical protein [Dehalococcoidia bacterium]MDZ4278977.1 hypothetical protein [Dehalococcoidia bacterium]